MTPHNRVAYSLLTEGNQLKTQAFKARIFRVRVAHEGTSDKGHLSTFEIPALTPEAAKLAVAEKLPGEKFAVLGIVEC